MLLEISIKNFAIIDDVKIEFSKGLNVLTGETGSGKSMVVDALEILLGGRSSVDMIRSGKEKCKIEGIWQIDIEKVPLFDPLKVILDEADLMPEDGVLILTREINSSGRTLARINGYTIPINLLERVGRHLVDIHGQSEHLSLLSRSKQLDLLDSYADLVNLKRELSQLVDQYRKILKQKNEIMNNDRENQRKADLLNFQIQEIDSAKLEDPNEEEILKNEKNRLLNAEKLGIAAEMAYETLYGGKDEIPSALDLLKKVSYQLYSIKKLDPSFDSETNNLDEIIFQLEDISRCIRNYADSIEVDPARLEIVEDRLSLIKNIKRKYGDSFEEIALYRENAENELNSIYKQDEILKDLTEKEIEILKKITDLSLILSNHRKKAADILAADVETHLADLGMGQSRFEITIQNKKAGSNVVKLADLDFYADSSGIDEVEFLLSANPGEPPKSLSKIASGGEMARIMLALKNSLSDADTVPTLVFDEVDSGISGRIGLMVAQKLCKLSNNHQVICVTHLPQIAAYADSHFSVKKNIVDGHTYTNVDLLKNEQSRIDELALMLHGSLTDISKDNARELLDLANNWKEVSFHKKINKKS